jgi:hypothetical protein
MPWCATHVYDNRSSVNKCLAAAAMNASTQVDKKAKYKNRHQATQTSGITLNGRELNVVIAVDRADADARQEENKKKKVDKRNLWLAKEGVIYPDSFQAEGISESNLSSFPYTYATIPPP